MKRYISVCAVFTMFLTTACQRIIPQEITELVLSNCLAPVSLTTTVVNDYDVRFSWMVGKDADSYSLIVATDAEITEIVCQETVLPSEVPYVVTLDPGVYYYKVQALAEDRGASHWSYGEFCVNRPVCDAPGHLAVSVTNDNQAEFSWDVSREDDSYELVVAADEDFTEVLTSVSLTMEQIPYSISLEDGAWYYRVRALAKGHDASSWTICQTPLVIMKTVDLSSMQTANCYIINDYGKYKFRTTKGNSSEAVGQVAAVEVIWETSVETSALNCNSVIVSANSDEEGYISFLTAEPFKEGNALIAAKDAQGKILWSWHIWCVSEPVRDVDLGNGIVLMDKNIGEVCVGSSVYAGMLYQWGRKDPFPGTLSNGVAVSVAGNAVSHKGGQVTGVAVTVENPAVLYGDISTETVGAQPYFLGKGTIDGINSGDYDYWGSPDSDMKTVYDPCPAGYRVPYAFDASFVNDNEVSKTRFSFFSGFLYDGESFELTMDNGACLKFRRSGHILLNTSVARYKEASPSVADAGNAFLLWTASKNNKRLSGCIRVSESDGAQFWGKAGDSAAEYQAKNNAYPVRCEKIR